MRASSRNLGTSGGRVYRRSVLRLAGLGLLPAMAFSSLVAYRRVEEADENASWPSSFALRLPAIPNFRDIAGAQDQPAYRNGDNMPLRRGVFYRSGRLNAEGSDLRRLQLLGVQAVYDLRSGEARKAEPDHIPEGIRYVPVPLAEPLLLTPDLTLEERMRLLVTDPDARAHTASLLEHLAQAAAPCIYHCGTGRHMTGWVTALLHTMAGLPTEAIFLDFLAGNEAQPRVAHASTLLAAMRAAATHHGSVEGFIRDGLRLSSATRQKLRGRMLA